MRRGIFDQINRGSVKSSVDGFLCEKSVDGKGSGTFRLTTHSAKNQVANMLSKI